jgi:hypothetical protein
MITIEGGRDDIRLRGVRKATLTKRAVLELRLKIDCALEEEVRRRLGRSAVDFLIDIRKKTAASMVRLSKKQRDTADEILAKAFSDDPVVFLEGEALAELGRLISHATADVRLSAFEEYVIVKFKPRLKEPIIAVSEKLWRIVDDIKRKTYFGRPEEPPLIDIDGLVENEDPDGLPPEPDGTEVDRARHWAFVSVHEDEDY